MNKIKRNNLLIENYVEARLSGSLSGYDIRPVSKDSFEHFYILIHPKAGVYKDHSYIIEMKTTYGTDHTTYPINSPYMHFITDVFHVNVSAKGGAICLDMLKDKSKWSSLNSFDTIVQNILLLFDEPNNSSPFNGDASRIWIECEKQYKANSNSKMSVKELDAIHERCFQPFNDAALRVMKNNNIKQYAKWFPYLDLDDPDFQKRTDDDMTDFNIVKGVYNELQAKRAKNRSKLNISDTPKPDKSSDKSDPPKTADADQPDQPKTEDKADQPKIEDQPKPEDKPGGKKNRWAKYQKP